jgi:hypothetical protein
VAQPERREDPAFELFADRRSRRGLDDEAEDDVVGVRVRPPVSGPKKQRMRVATETSLRGDQARPGCAITARTNASSWR